jgi:hypothetical protein
MSISLTQAHNALDEQGAGRVYLDSVDGPTVRVAKVHYNTLSSRGNEIAEGESIEELRGSGFLLLLK